MELPHRNLTKRYQKMAIFEAAPSPPFPSKAHHFFGPLSELGYVVTKSQVLSVSFESSIF